MRTLVEFMTQTKGIEYLLAVGFLFAFVAFWWLLHFRGKGLARRLIPPTALMLGMASLAWLRITATPAGPGPPPAQKSLLSSTVLVDLYGPASWDHEAHEDMVEDCKLCHHQSGDKVLPCKECHGEPFNPQDLSKPGLAHVYHLRCISCHKENQEGPVACEGCHKKAAVPPLSVAHPLTGEEKCLRCHGPKGVRSVTKIPKDHAGTPETVCRLCHRPSIKAAELAVHEIPHEVAGQSECLICHGEGIAGARKVPADHAGRTDETCLLCHTTKVQKEPGKEAQKQPEKG